MRGFFYSCFLCFRLVHIFVTFRKEEEMKMKEYKVKTEMAPHLIFVLDRDHIRYQYYTPKGEDYFLFYVDANSHFFKI